MDWMTAASIGAATEEPDACWGFARVRTTVYLVAAGVEPTTAAARAGEITHAIRRRDADIASSQAAARAALREARAWLASHPGMVGRRAAAADDAPDAIAPPAAPLAMPRSALGSAFDKRPATSRGRLSLPAAASARPSCPPVAAEAARRRLLAKAWRRRMAFVLLTLLTSGCGTVGFLRTLGVDGIGPLDIARAVVLGILLLWLAQSFWTLTAGAAVLAVRRHRGSAPAPPAVRRAACLPRTAIIMPICNEATDRVFAGLRAMWEDLERLPEAKRLDLFVLSDTTDPDLWLAEIEAWADLRAALPSASRIFYRRRLHNIGRKTGNIEDFIGRWGAAYGYLLVLDADSLMTAAAMAELVRRMDGHPEVGLIQAPPRLARGRSLFARMLQTADRLYGPLAASGIGFWALGEANYWGHNAIIRVAPFAALCGLPPLPGRAPLGGEIMSHDFVEAALLRRGGWQVWIADDLEGSYEEPPPGLAEFAIRDRRWCQGNMQHARILTAGGLHWVSRLHLAIGVMSFATSPLWLLFVILSAARLASLSPGRSVTMRAEAASLLPLTLALLVVPKLVAVALTLLHRRHRQDLRGSFRVAVGAVLECLHSVLLAPVMMLLHTGFILRILAGAAIDWNPQRRQATAGALRAAWHRFGAVTLLVVAAALTTAALAPQLVGWLLPVLAGPVLVLPLAVLGGSNRAGDWFARRGLLVAPEEHRPPWVLARLEQLLSRCPPPQNRFIKAVRDPGFNALHLAVLRANGIEPPAPSPATRAAESRALHGGLAGLSRQDRLLLLEDPAVMDRLHLASWSRLGEDDGGAGERQAVGAGSGPWVGPIPDPALHTEAPERGRPPALAANERNAVA